MKKRNKWIIGGLLSVVLMLPVLAILPWIASDAVTAVYYLVFTTKPNQQELAGQYKVILNWGTAELTLRENGTFEESITDQSNHLQKINGNWSSESTDAGHGAAVSMSPYLEVQDDSHGRTFSYATLNFYKPRFGSVFGELNPDSGSRFEKQSQ